MLVMVMNLFGMELHASGRSKMHTLRRSCAGGWQAKCRCRQRSRLVAEPRLQVAATWVWGPGDNGAVGGDRVDFFISHAGADLAWAEWVDAQLRAAGYTCVLDSRDCHVGDNFVLAMNDALDRCDRVVALFSEAYFDRSRYTTQEWLVALLHTPEHSCRLIPVRIEDVGRDRIPPLLRPLLYRDVFGLDERAAREALLAAVGGSGGLDRDVSYPGLGSTIRLPGALPIVRRLPPRNRGFTGRDGLLLLLRERLLAGDRAVVQALRGMAGVGKTQ